MYSTNPKAAARTKSKTEANKPTEDSAENIRDSARRQRAEWTIRDDPVGTRGLTSFLLCLDHAALFSKYPSPSQSLLYTGPNSFPSDSKYPVL